MIYGAGDSLVRDIYLGQIRMHMRTPQQRIAQSVGGNFDLRWTATSLSEAISKHDIPAIYARFVDGLCIRDFDLSWGVNLPPYFSGALQSEDSKNIDYVDSSPLERQVQRPTRFLSSDLRLMPGRSRVKRLYGWVAPRVAGIARVEIQSVIKRFSHLCWRSRRKYNLLSKMAMD